MIFKGTATALVTPFTPDGAIDFGAFNRLLDTQIAAGIEGVVPCGSTGEAATMTHDEKVALIRHTVEYVAGRTKVIAGTGSNDTRASITLTKEAEDLGADAVLLVAPYYNKPTQHGHIEHYRAIADSTDIPMIIYNVPGRTGSNMSAETQLAIASLSRNIIATKEASANLEQMQEIIRNAPEHFTLLSGDDSLALPAISCGATGVIAVISNYAPKRFGGLIRSALAGDFAAARKEQYSLLAMMKVNFIESNPIPVKFILHESGLIGETYRLPLTPMQESNKAIVRTAMQAAGTLA